MEKQSKNARNVDVKNKAKVERDPDIPNEPQQKKFDEAKRARAAEDLQHKKAGTRVRVLFSICLVSVAKASIFLYIIHIIRRGDSI
jgi:hypothetical protein